jgi:bifunctional NMN adenylyltransferase/nudix hydrolase
MNKEKTYIVFCGRFQPFHNAHLQTIKNALALADEVCIIVGSYRQTPTVKNPWTYEMRETMIRSCFTPQENDRIKIAPMRDYLYNDNTWITSMYDIIAKMTNHSDNVKIIGHKKDESTEYLEFFPTWEWISQPNFGGINATDIRVDLFTHAMIKDSRHMLPECVTEHIYRWKAGNELFTNLIAEFEFVKKYRDSWKVAPYPPTFVTSDAVCVKSGHVLVIKRGMNPGKGLFALPGGFVNQDEFVEDAAIRELREETGKWMSVEKLRERIENKHVFDHPKRDPRGRCITHAFLFKLNDKGPLPLVKAEDDAAEALWMPFSDVIANEERFYADHAHIICYFINKL